MIIYRNKKIDIRDTMNIKTDSKYEDCEINIHKCIKLERRINVKFSNCKIKLENKTEECIKLDQNSKVMFTSCEIISTSYSKPKDYRTIVTEGKLHFEDCTIQNITNFIEIKCIKKYSVKFLKCKFDDNRGYILRDTFKEDDLEGDLYIDNCSIENHYKHDNDDIFDMGNCSLNITNSNFRNIKNTILYTGEKNKEITIRNNIFEKCSSKYRYLLYVYSDKLTIKNNIFNECDVLYINGQGTITNCKFYRSNINKTNNNDVDNLNVNIACGAMYIKDSKNIYIEKCIFENCIKNERPAIKIIDSTNIDIKENIFLNINDRKYKAIQIYTSDINKECKSLINIENCLTDKMKNLDISRIEDNKNGKSFRIYTEKLENSTQTKYEKTDDNLNVLVMATMSAGKSTIINSLIGEEILPSKNEACTAKIMTYTIDNKLEYAEANSYGESKSYYDKISSEEIQKLNEDKSISKVEFRGPIKSSIQIRNNITFIDTPGVNNSQDKSHLEITYNELEKGNFDTIMYIINATQIGTDDDAQLLAKLKSYLKNNKKDIVFVLNKIDMVDDEKEDIDELFKSTISYIKNKVGIKTPKIISTSAYNSNLIKKEMYKKELTRKEKRDLMLYKDYVQECNISYEKYSSITHSKSLEKIIDDENFKLLNSTGIVNIEKYLSEVEILHNKNKSKNSKSIKNNQSQTNKRNNKKILKKQKIKKV